MYWLMQNSYLVRMNCRPRTPAIWRCALQLRPLVTCAFIVFLTALIQPFWSAAYTEDAEAGERPVLAETTKGTSQKIREITKQVYRLLVEVEGAVKGGTGFLVSGQRIIATNYHVIENGATYSVGFIDEKGGVRRIPLRLLAVFPQKDLALLEALDELPGAPLPLVRSDPDLAGDLFAIGYPAAADPQGVPSWTHGEDMAFFVPSVLKGYVSRVLTNRWFSSQLQHQTPIIPGYSGGPLIDPQGLVVAISSSIHKNANGISYGVLARDLADLLEACSLPVNVAQVNEPSSGLQSVYSHRAAKAAKLDAGVAAVHSSASDDALLERGTELLERGNIVAARLLFGYLADHQGSPDAYVGLAKTYDPIFLNEKNVIGVSGDAGKAREFYEKAFNVGRLTAEQRMTKPLRAAKAGGCNGSTCSLVNSPRGPVVTCDVPDPILTNNTASKR